MKRKRAIYELVPIKPGSWIGRYVKPGSKFCGISDAAGRKIINDGLVALESSRLEKITRYFRMAQAIT